MKKPLLTVRAPAQNVPSAFNLQDAQRNLDDQITRMLQKGHLRPGIYNDTRYLPILANFENPGETLYTLTQAYPLVSPSLKPDLEKYIKQHYKWYFDDKMDSRTGYWIDNPPAYDLNNPSGFGQLQPREWMPTPPEVAQDLKNYPEQWTPTPDQGYWSYPQHNIYAMWLFAKTFYSNDQTKLDSIYAKAKDKLDSTPPDNNFLLNQPWVHNAYIDGYIGFLNLQELANKMQIDSQLRSTTQAQLDQLLSLRVSDFRKDRPDNVQEGEIRLNLARNFMYLTPELGNYLNKNGYNQVKEAIDEYNRVAPYWVAARYEASVYEFSSDNRYTHPAMFQAKAYILKESAEQLLK